MAGQISSTFDIIYENSSGSAGTTTIVNTGRTMRVESCLYFAEPGATIVVRKNDGAGVTIATGPASTGLFNEELAVAPYSGGVAADAILSKTDNIHVTSTGGSLSRLIVRCVAADGQAITAPDMA
jgi:hypothetical protein